MRVHQTIDAMSIKRKLLWTAVFLAIVAVWLVLHFVSKPPTLPVDLPADQQIEAKKLLEIFLSTDTMAQKKLEQQIIEVKGKLLEVSMDDNKHATLILETGDPLNTVNASLFFCDEGSKKKYGSQCDDAENVMKAAIQLKPGDDVLIKGRCTGFLDMSGVILNQCTLIPQSN
jgi:hypothetical protein